MSRHDKVPNEVTEFLQDFAESIKKGDLAAIMENYSDRWENIIKQNYRATSWPTAQAINAKLDLTGDFQRLFLCLYKQLFYRHKFQRLEPVEEDPHAFVEDYIHSFENFVNLFNIFIKEIWSKSDGELSNIVLPNVWLWDIIHSFVSQCQSFHLWKTNLDDPNIDSITEEQERLLAQNSEAWHLLRVFRYLTVFAWCAGIRVRLSPLEYNKPTCDMQRCLGQFSVIGMLRLHTILGDYTTALEVLETIELRTNNAVTSFKTCDLTISYYMAVCYMMKGRFQDALAIVPEVETKYGTLFETENVQTVTHQVHTWYNKLKHLSNACKYMCWDSDTIVVASEDVQCSNAKEWLLDQFEEAKPDYISPKMPSLETHNTNYVKEQQRVAFELLVTPRFELDHIHTALTVYRTCDLETLGNDIGKDNFLTQLLKYKMATRQMQKGVDDLPHEGKWSCSCDSDFFIKDNYLETRQINSDTSYAEDLSRLILNVSRFNRTLTLRD